MFNPIDTATTKAMNDYRAEQINRDLDEGDHDEMLVEKGAASSPGLLTQARRSVGISLMRAGARMAGVGMQTRVGLPL